ncbi:MAG: hypothetical protein ISQ19_02625 [PS1 clade bacterium]|uniref:Uncharacterized protein n=1 Tax=PS1 clade bacterium TaxID=2175152 RepID=A0A937HHG8_9PROT|nr:hypothetical protein [PS1 clade bacterium]
MIFASNSFAAQPGHADEFTGQMASMLGVMLEHDVQAGIKVSVSGTHTTEVFINSVFPDMKAYAAATANMRQSAKWVEVYMSIGNSAATVPLDSMVAEVLPGFDDAPSLSEGVIMLNMWRALPGRLADLKGGMAIAKEMHMQHGASAVRAYQVYGGRYNGCFGYNVSFADMAAMGSWWDSARDDNEKFFDEAGKNPSAEIQAQVILDNPAVIGK